MIETIYCCDVLDGVRQELYVHCDICNIEMFLRVFIIIREFQYSSTNLYFNIDTFNQGMLTQNAVL